MSVLLPLWDEPASWGTDLFGSNDLLTNGGRQQWDIDLRNVAAMRDVEARALPTPLAWPGMMEAVLLRHDLREHVLRIYYRELILGILLGNLDVEIVDLKRGRLGAIVVETNELFRYFGIIRATPKLDRLKGTIFGGTSPDTLVWPSPRTKDTEWKALGDANNSDQQGNAKSLLSGFREILQGLGFWNPGHTGSPPWMAALDEVIGDWNAAGGRKLLDSHSRSVGPIRTQLGPNRRPDAIYLPTLERGFASKFLRATTGSLLEEPEKQRVVLLDDARVPQFIIMKPTGTDPGGDHMKLAGAGTIREDATPEKTTKLERRTLRLIDSPAGKGLLSCFPEMFLSPPPKATEVRRMPMFYPDIVRIVVTKLGESALPNSRVLFTPAAMENIFSEDFPGLPSPDELGDSKYVSSERWKGCLAKLPGDARQLVMLERLGGEEVLDLSALGMVLWLYFIGEANYENESIRDRRSVPLVVKESFVPLCPDEAVYRTVKEVRSSPGRLATLQRFVKAYSQGAEDIDQMMGHAAKAFAERTWKSEVIPLGHSFAEKNSVSLASVRISLYRDEK